MKNDNVLSMLGLAKRGGNIVSGEFSVENAIRDGSAYLVVIAKDASDKTKKKFSVSMQHYTFAVSAFVELVKQFGMDEYEFAVHETKTYDVIDDVKNFRSEIGILYVNDFNQKVLYTLLRDCGLEFHELLRCSIYVYLCKGHPLANRKLISLDDLREYPCLSFDQGAHGSF